MPEHLLHSVPVPASDACSHVHMIALKPCRSSPERDGGMPLVLYDVFLLVNVQAASLCGHSLAISG